MLAVLAACWRHSLCQSRVWHAKRDRQGTCSFLTSVSLRSQSVIDTVPDTCPAPSNTPSTDTNTLSSSFVDTIPTLHHLTPTHTIPILRHLTPTRWRFVLSSETTNTATHAKHTTLHLSITPSPLSSTFIQRFHCQLHDEEQPTCLRARRRWWRPRSCSPCSSARGSGSIASISSVGMKTET